MEISGNENIIKNNRYYAYDEIEIKHSKNPFRKIPYYIGRLFQALADICFGIDSDFKFCCIRAFIIGKKYRVDELQQIVCHKCYKRLLRKK